MISEPSLAVAFGANQIMSSKLRCHKELANQKGGLHGGVYRILQEHHAPGSQSKVTRSNNRPCLPKYCAPAVVDQIWKRYRKYLFTQ